MNVRSNERAGTVPSVSGAACTCTIEDAAPERPAIERDAGVVGGDRDAARADAADAFLVQQAAARRIRDRRVCDQQLSGGEAARLLRMFQIDRRANAEERHLQSECDAVTLRRAFQHSGQVPPLRFDALDARRGRAGTRERGGSPARSRRQVQDRAPSVLPAHPAQQASVAVGACGSLSAGIRTHGDRTRTKALT